MCDQPLDTWTVGEMTVKIYPDEIAPDPRKDYDRAGMMICFHERYDLGDAHDYKKEDFASWLEVKQQIEKDYPNALILPLYLMDHSGLSLSTTSSLFQVFDHEGWDWRQVGFIFMPQATINEWYGGDNDSAIAGLQAEVEEYDQYLQGDVYWVVVEDPSGCIRESVGGMYGGDVAKTHANELAEFAMRERYKRSACPR